MDKRKCSELIEKIRENYPDCPAVRLHDSWKGICGFPNRIEIDLCEACKDLGSEIHECYCDQLEKKK